MSVLPTKSPAIASNGYSTPPTPDLTVKRRSDGGEREEREVGSSRSAVPLSRSQENLKVAGIILGWITLSTAVILYNREIMMGSAHFEYPISLTSLHLTYQTIATRLLHRYTNLICGTPPPSQYQAIPMTESRATGAADESDAETLQRAKDASVDMSWEEWRKKIVPPAVLFSASLVLSNWAYLYLTTAFIHMLKAFSPVAILLAAFAFGTKSFSLKLVLIVLVISGGVGLASYGEVKFNWTGVTIQMVAIAIEATRVTLIQILLQGSSMSPLLSLYYFAPICLSLNAAMIIPIEGWAAIRAVPALGFFTILSNCTLTFLLNLSAVYLISVSSMVLSLSKVVKDVLLVAGSAVLLGDKLTSLQVVGYGLATLGLFWYKASPS